MSFATRLKEWREARGLSREELSGLCGLGRGTVRDYEQGRREPTWSSLVKLADALGVTLEAFRDPSPAPEPPTPRGVAEVLETHFGKGRQAATDGKRKRKSKG